MDTTTSNSLHYPQKACAKTRAVLKETNNLTWTVGQVRITRVEEVVTYMDASVLMPSFTPDMLDPHRDWLVPNFFSERNGKMALSIHSFVVESQGTTIVIDTCVGGQDKALPSDPNFPDRLGAAIAGGLDAVDIVLCTHLHFDHVGWNMRTVDGQQVPTFPNARYLFARVEVEHTRTDDHMSVLAPSIDPIIAAGMADLVDTDHTVTSEVCLLPTPGHTPGHVSVLIESDGESALITGDMTHTPLQFALPDLAASAFDTNSEQSTQTRVDIIDRFADSDTLVLGTHFAPPTAGHVIRSGDSVRFS
jgi:glyoxylase-like metal-dependent hydrolase (beta-lactamase superfamily II)